MVVPKRRATYEDLIAVPGNLVAEILEGELVTSPRPAFPHARVASVVMTELASSFDGPDGLRGGPGGWWLLFEPELHLHGDVVVPDAAGWRHERMPSVPDVAACDLPPDWVCEVISPSTSRYDRGAKLRIYAREGVAHLWIVDPILRTLEVLRLEAGRWVVASTHVADEAARAEPFDAVELRLGRWWLAPSN